MEKLAELRNKHLFAQFPEFVFGHMVTIFRPLTHPK